MMRCRRARETMHRSHHVRQWFCARLHFRGVLRAQSSPEAPVSPQEMVHYLRVITLADKVTILNAFPDRGVQTVKLSYFADTDSLYIDLSEEPSVESREISEGVVLDYNAAGRLVGIDIDEASKRVQMDKLVLSQLPSTVETAAA